MTDTVAMGPKGLRPKWSKPHPRKGTKRSPEVVANVRAAAAKRVRPLAERFWAKVDRSGGVDACWLWRGAIRAHGYGHIFTHNDERGRPATELAHRVAIMLDGQEMPVWPMVVDHICKDMACVNVRHLRIVSQTENTTIYADRSKANERFSATMAAKRAKGSQ